MSDDPSLVISLWETSRLEGSGLIIGRYSCCYGASTREYLTYLCSFFIATILSPNLIFFWIIAFGMKSGVSLLMLHNFFYWLRICRRSYDGTVGPVAFSMHFKFLWNHRRFSCMATLTCSPWKSIRLMIGGSNRLLTVATCLVLSHKRSSVLPGKLSIISFHACQVSGFRMSPPS